MVFLRPEFRMASTRTALVRSPIEWEVAILRATGVALDELQACRGTSRRLGQVLYLPPNVSGWRQNRAWISSSAMWAKGQIAALVRTSLDASGAWDGLAGLSVPDAVAVGFARFGIDDPSTATRQHLEAFLTGES